MDNLKLTLNLLDLYCRIAGGNAVAVLNHNKPEAYLLSVKAYEKLLDAVDDLALLKVIQKRRGGKTIR
ncbi:type II toxin-antitoxin system Phd/YefM family antitoxin [Polynucleobacter brandtiae]|uniref:type II toxin-antitoxin system Phd/YefM family antitoxin n=1 Tax=Polynucleobacter brandtiae TaxID=1938816 RepID=UPI0018E1FDAD|nr:type II toxin-antitoxin system Phd/YefM family antitoxin [Polynucleobacter brandtiae]